MGKHLRTIAIADDNGTFLSAAAAYVTRLPGFVLAGTAANVQEALALVERLAPDVLLLDLGIVPSRGLDVLRRVRALPQAPAVIALSLFHTAEAAREAKGAGAVALIGKDAFVAGLHEILARLFPSSDQLLRAR